jgi:Domain of unknown function (DUF4214)
MSRFLLVPPGSSAARGKNPYRPQFEALEDRCLLAADFHTLPVVPVIDPSMKSYLQSIYLLGQSLGQRADVFAKVGDSNSFNPEFLDGLGAGTFDPANPAFVGDNTNLADTINYFRQQSVDPAGANSFDHISAATYGGWTTLSLLTPGLRGVQPWMFGSVTATPLDAEIRQTRPAIALVMIGTCEVGQQDPALFQTNLALIAQDLLSQGVIPILSTIPEDLLPLPGLVPLTSEYNQIIANVAGNLNVPLWNLWVGLNQLPNQGIGPDGVHLPASPNGPELLDNADTVFGMNYRNLTAVQVLAKTVGVVELNEAPDNPPIAPSVPVTPFVVAVYQAILLRPVDTGGLALFSNELNQGVSAAVVVQQIWTSSEHRQIQIGQYYQQYFHRVPDAPGFGWWQQQFALGMNESQVQESMLTSTEYARSHPTDSSFVEGIYSDVLGRSLGAGEEIYWENQLQSGQTRLDVATALVQSTEAEQDLIDHLYRSYLGRPAEEGALISGIESLAGDQGGQLTLVQTILTSAEFLRRI